MKIFLDTAMTDEVRKYSNLGIIDGVTTNPSLIKKSGRSLKDVVLEMKEIVADGDISVEVLATDTEGMIREAHEYQKWNKDFTIKIPMTPEGIEAVSMLSKEGIKTNVTLIFSPTQAFLAAKVGATYVSPFLGRLDDISSDGLDLVAQIRAIFDTYDFDTQIIAASIRHPEHVRSCLAIGADICTLPPKILDQLFCHPLTDIGIEKFLADSRG